MHSECFNSVFMPIFSRNEIYFRIVLTALTILIAIISLLLARKFIKKRKFEIKYLQNELIEVESFISILASYLKLDFSPEFALARACNEYNGSLKKKIKLLIENQLYSGAKASHLLHALSTHLLYPESKRILKLFAKLVEKEPKRAGRMWDEVIRNLREIRDLKLELEIMMSQMRVRALLLAMISSLVYALMVRLSSIMTIGFSLQNYTFHSVSIITGLSKEFSASLFIAFAILVLVNSYYVSLITGIRSSLLLSITALTIYFLAYILASALLAFK